MPKILNLRHEDGKGLYMQGHVVVVDRRSIYGNPYHIGRDGTREEVIAKFREYVKMRPFSKEELLVIKAAEYVGCWCWPYSCHSEVVIEEAMK